MMLHLTNSVPDFIIALSEPIPTGSVASYNKYPMLFVFSAETAPEKEYEESKSK
ncbi:hypothetical protein GCM10027516_01270 [Niabella aquatica]